MGTIELSGRGSRGGAVSVAHALLWVQAALFAVMWFIPNGMVAAIVVSDGVPDDESAPWLLIPVIYSAPLLLFAVPAIVLAARFARGRRGVHGGIVAFEVSVVGASVLALAAAGAAPVIGVLGLPVVVGAAAGAYVLVVLLRSQGRAYFGRPRLAR